MRNRSIGLKLFVTVVALFMGGVVAQATLSVGWSAGYGNFLYGDDGNFISQSIPENFSVELVLDMGATTDFQAMIGVGQLDSGVSASNLSLGGAHSSSASDVVYGTGSLDDGIWLYEGNFDDRKGAGTYLIADDYDTPFYLRWFNSSSYDTASEVGFIYSTDNSWVTQSDPGTGAANPLSVSANYSGANVGGTSFGGAGWQTVAAVPEPGSMGLLALGLVTLVARKRKRA